MNREIEAVVLLGLFTLGCIAIHGLRRHAKQMTPVLILTVLCLGPITGLVALALRPKAMSYNSGSAFSLPKRSFSDYAQAESDRGNSIKIAQVEKAKRQDRTQTSTDAAAPLSKSSDAPTRTALPEQDASPDGLGEKPGSPASLNAELIK